MVPTIHIVLTMNQPSIRVYIPKIAILNIMMMYLYVSCSTSRIEISWYSKYSDILSGISGINDSSDNVMGIVNCSVHNDQCIISSIFNIGNMKNIIDIEIPEKIPLYKPCLMIRILLLNLNRFTICDCEK